MCERSACLPTPREAAMLIDRGYGARLARYAAHIACVGPAPQGSEGKTVHSTNGRCTFFDGVRCELHALGLKPLEGRIAHHDRDWRVTRSTVLRHWRPADYAYLSGRLA
jgi:hypothetical protein